MNELYIKLPNQQRGIIIRVYKKGNDILRKKCAGIKVKVMRKNQSPLIRIFFKHELVI